MIQELLRKTKLKEVMTAPVITVRETDEFHIVWEKFAIYDIRHLPVVNQAGCVVAIITERQLFKIHSPRHLEDGSWYYDRDMLDEFILKNVMIKEPFLLKADNTLEDAMRAIAQFKIGCIPIVDDHRLPVGIVTRNNVISYFLKHA